MNDPSNFLSRWSRRKRQATDVRAEKTGVQVRVEPPPAGEQMQSMPVSAQSRAGAGEFDVSSLPSIDSIGPGTDLAAFMQPGVPLALRHAALRRAWSADPAIRDFMGPNENFWDGVGPEGIPGFGDLDPGLDVKRLVSELFGETTSEPKSNDAASVSPVAAAKPLETSGTTESSGSPKSVDASVASEERPSHAENGAPQKQSPQKQSERKIARRHGGAVPE
jgi:hypothetical protein